MTQSKTFYCEHCQETFIQEVAEAALFAFCEPCKKWAGLYRAAEPLLSKPIENWSGSDWVTAIVVSVVAYKLLNA